MIPRYQIDLKPYQIKKVELKDKIYIQVYLEDGGWELSPAGWMIVYIAVVMLILFNI